MIQKVNQEYKPLFTEKPRYFILMGGRGAGRSTVASQFATSKLTSDQYFRCAIMRYVLGDIRNSIYKEIIDRTEEQNIKDSLKVNDSVMSVSYGRNSINAVGFKKSSHDQKSKLKSLANYNCVIIEEADEIPEEDFMQLDDSLRTLKGNITIILLLNPPAKSHWIIKRWFDLFPAEVKDFYIPELKPDTTDTIFIRTDYTINKANIAPQSITNYERYKDTKPSHYYNMVKGYVPEVVRGRIYSGWEKIAAVPHEAQFVRMGLDFGYSNDPTAIVGVYQYNGGLIFDQIAYNAGMLNGRIAAVLQMQEMVLTIADSQEPKSIDEIALYEGILIQPSVKGADSIRSGIDKVKEYKIWVTERSKKIWEEYENYAWFEDKDGNTQNIPKPGYDHAMDAIRYAVVSLTPPVNEEKKSELRQKRQERRQRVKSGYAL